MLAWPGIMVLLSSRIATALACIVSACLGPVPVPLLAAYVLVGCLLLLRTPYAADGAEQFMHVTAMACLVAAISPEAFAGGIGLFFLSCAIVARVCHLQLSSRWPVPKWPNGRFLVEIFATESFGRRPAWEFLTSKPHRWAKRAAQLVIYGEPPLFPSLPGVPCISRGSCLPAPHCSMLRGGGDDGFEYVYFCVWGSLPGSHLHFEDSLSVGLKRTLLLSSGHQVKMMSGQNEITPMKQNTASRKIQIGAAVVLLIAAAAALGLMSRRVPAGQATCVPALVHPVTVKKKEHRR